MIICSPSVQNVLDRLYVKAVTMGKQPVEYNRCIEAIRSVESGIIRIVAQKPLSWVRARLFVAKSGRYWFGYVMQNNVVIVDEVFDCVRNTIIDESVNKHIITVTESDLRVLILECVHRVLSESKNSGNNLEKMGEWNVVAGSKMLGEYKGMEQFGWLEDWRLYDKNGEGIMVFSLGPGSVTGGEGNKVVCARITTGQNHLPLRYKPLKKKDIPQEILRDIQRKRFSES